MTKEEAAEYWEGLRKTFSSQLEKEENYFGRMHLQTTINVLDTTISALRQQEPNDWICTLKCTALMEEGMCSHGGLCCLYESQRTIKENEPLTLDELRQMDGEPVWLVGLENGDRWVHIDSIDSLVIRFSMFGNSETWCFRTASYGVRVWAYHQKQKEN